MAKVQTNLYFYHLGSSSWITDSGGHAIQHLQYLPFGETRVDQRTTSWNTRYSFSAKEKDEESGYGYFGARYYDSDISIWISPDKLLSDYHSISCYSYCANNPIILVDPDGNNPILPFILLGKAAGYIMEKYGHNSNIKTVGYAMNHPIIAARTGNEQIPSWGLSKIASNFTQNLIHEAGFSKYEGSQSNAFRHVLWQSMLTNELGAEHATRIANAHEGNLPTNMNQRIFNETNAADQADQMADLLNNVIGREIGEKNKRASNNTLAKKVLDAYKNNGFWQSVDKGNGIYSVEKTKLKQDKYDAALKVIQSKGNNGLNKEMGLDIFFFLSLLGNFKRRRKKLFSQNYIYLLLLLPLFYGCTRHTDEKIINYINENKCLKYADSCYIDLREVLGVDYDKLYLFLWNTYSELCDDYISKIVGIKYHFNPNRTALFDENLYHIILTKGNQIVYDDFYHPYNIPFYTITDEIYANSCEVFLYDTIIDGVREYDTYTIMDSVITNRDSFFIKNIIEKGDTTLYFDQSHIVHSSSYYLVRKLYERIYSDSLMSIGMNYSKYRYVIENINHKNTQYYLFNQRHGVRIIGKKKEGLLPINTYPVEMGLDIFFFLSLLGNLKKRKKRFANYLR